MEVNLDYKQKEKKVLTPTEKYYLEIRKERERMELEKAKNLTEL